MPLQLSASLNLTGSINLSGSMSSTQTLNLTASYSVNSATSSYISSSNINGTVLSSSYSLSSSFAPVNTNITASWSNNSFTASYVVNAQSASYYGGNVISSSYSLSSSFAPTNTNITASWSTNSLTASSLVVTNNYTASRLNITSTGSFTIVGIATTSPSSKLQIGSNSTYTGSDNSVNVRIGDSLLASRVYPLTLANTAGAFINNEVALSFIVGGTIQATGIISTILRNTGTLASDIVFTNYNSGLYERMRITGDGYVGIGTSSPTNVLTVYNSSTPTIDLNTGTSTSRGRISATSSDLSIDALTSSPLLFKVDSSEKMRVAANGNVGIGTSSPASKLDIRGGTQLLNTSGSTNSATSASLMLVGQNTKGGANYHDFLYTSNTVAGGVNPQKYFRQDNTGNIEIVNSAYNNTIFILTDSGSLQLPVAQSSNVTQLRNTGAGLKISGLSIFDDGNPHIHNTTPSTNMWINVSGSGNVIINGQTGASGGVCIGSTNSRGKLDVNGSVNYDQGTFYYYANIYGGTSSGTIPISVYATDRMAASEFDARSDRRLKKDIRVIDTQMALQFVKTSKPVLYKWNIGSDDGDKSGYIAQDIIKIGFPHLVSGIPNDDIKQETDSDGYISPDKVQLSMNYDQVVPLLDVALKNALQRIEQLEAKLAALENKIN